MKPHKIGKCGKPLHEKSMKKLVKMDEKQVIKETGKKPWNTIEFRELKQVLK